jgi:hypothetical protein
MAVPINQLPAPKLVFIPCKDASCTEEATEFGRYTVMYNPNNIALKLAIEREETQATGNTTAPMNFKRIKPQDYTFEFIIDGTGANGEPKKDVPEDVEKFLKVVYVLDGTTHKPNFVMILYGKVLLKCVLKSVDITYTLFSPAGVPLRAKVNATFISCLDQDLSEMINRKTSPDLTHARKLKRSDKLISMANSIYNKNSYYLEVARANDLDTFRNLPEGTDIFFPPLAK